MQALFIAFNDETDSGRANHVRKCLLGTGRFLVEGYAPFTTWANANNGSPLADLKTQYDEQLNPCNAALILIGEDCAVNPWIRYAIEKCYVSSKPLLAIDISSIPDEFGKTCVADLNPLQRFAVLEQGRKIYLDSRYATYQWSEDIAQCIDDWLALARDHAEQTERSKEQMRTIQRSQHRDYESMRLAKGVS